MNGDDFVNAIRKLITPVFDMNSSGIVRQIATVDVCDTGQGSKLTHSAALAGAIILPDKERSPP